VCKDVLDHTSIIKTILLRHRAKIPTRVFTQFGPRVNMIAHLGVALELDKPRVEPPPRLQRLRVAAGAVSTTGGEVERRDDFHESLRRAPLPKRR
jgi:hypothetical protein